MAKWASRPAKILLALGVVVFSASFYFNYRLGVISVGDTLETVGTALLVGGAYLIVSEFSQSKVVKGLFLTAAGCLVLARVFDLMEEWPAVAGWPLVSNTGAYHNLSVRVLESFGYVCVLLTLLAVLHELGRLKALAEQAQERIIHLHAASLLLARVADTSADAVFGFDAKGLIRTWNAGAARLFNYTRDEAIGKGVQDLLEGDGVRFDEAFVERLRSEQAVEAVELTGVAKDGRRFPVEATLSPVLEEQPESECLMVGVSAIVRDIAEKKRKQDELVTSRNLLAGALHSADVGMFIIRPSFELVEHNARMEDLTGDSWSPGLSMIDVAERNFDPAADFVRSVRTGVFEEGTSVEFRNLRVQTDTQGGHARICNMALSPILDDDGNVIAAGGIAVDITDREALQAKLLESQKLESVGRLAGGIAHDFNNILGGILGYASLMQRKLSDDSPFSRYVQSIEESANRAAELTQQLLAFSRGGKYEVKRLQLNSAITDTVRMVTASLSPNINVVLDLAEDLVEIDADPAQLKQILMNLFINARDAIGEAGTIKARTENIIVGPDMQRRLDLRRKGSYVLLTVEDDGCGMSSDVCDRIFEPFFSTKEKGSGYGLGLSVVYGIVQDHNGCLSISSKPNVGTCVQVYLPGAEPAETAVPPEAPSPTGFRGSETILVADDEQLIRALLEDVFATEGYTVMQASSGEEALSIYRRHADQVKLVILDLVMPGMGGERAYRQFRETAPELPCIISTGHGKGAALGAAANDPRVRFLPKPYQVPRLMTCVRELLDA